MAVEVGVRIDRHGGTDGLEQRPVGVAVAVGVRGGKVEPDLPATARTRAANRAISDLVAFGAVSAEEADAGAPIPPSSMPAWAQPGDVAAAANAAGEQAQALGQSIFELCGGEFPHIAERILAGLADLVGAGAFGEAAATTNPDTPEE